jgi:dihydroorotate dehydrogenase
LSEVYKLKISKPVFVKMPINLPVNEFDDLLQICVKYKINGVIIGNLTKVRDLELIKEIIPEGIHGGISGKPTQKLSDDLIEYTYRKYKDQLVIIGVGGIFSAEDAYRKIKKGATLVQLITGMIYEGPQLIGSINNGLAELLKKDGYTNISEAIGADII